jgi:hypothetical protein
MIIMEELRSSGSRTMPSTTLDDIFRLLQVANDLEEKKENRIEAATKVRSNDEAPESVG